MNKIFESLFENIKQMQNYSTSPLENQKQFSNMNFHQFLEFFQKNTMISLLTTKVLLDNNLDLLTKNFNEILLNANAQQSASKDNEKIDYAKIAQSMHNNSLECLQKNYTTINENILHAFNTNKN